METPGGAVTTEEARGGELTCRFVETKRVFLYLPDICGWYLNGHFSLTVVIDGISPLAWESEAARDSGGLTAEGPENPTDALVDVFMNLFFLFFFKDAAGTLKHADKRPVYARRRHISNPWPLYKLFCNRVPNCCLKENQTCLLIEIFLLACCANQYHDFLLSFFFKFYLYYVFLILVWYLSFFFLRAGKDHACF